MRFEFTTTDDSNFKQFQNIAILAHKAYCGRDAEGIVAELEELVESPPAFDLGQYWSYPELAALIGLSKRDRSIWDSISIETRIRLELIMEIFLYLGAYATQRNNNYHTGFAWRGNFSKKWNPNVKLSVYPLMVYCIDFFGGIETVNSMLTTFNFDSLMSKVKYYGFDRCYQCWNKETAQFPDGSFAPTAKQLLENGGAAYIKDKFGNVMFAGSGETIRQPYKQWNGGVWYLPKQLIEECYSGGMCRSRIDVDGDGTYDGHILDESTSPEDGKLGMLLEFNSLGGTTAAVRSSLHYCLVDFIMVSTLIAYADRIGWFKLEWAQDLKEKVTAGNADLFYKMDHGYRGRGLNEKEELTPEIVYTYYPAALYWRNLFE